MSTHTFTSFLITNQLNALKEKGDVTPEALEAALAAEAQQKWGSCIIHIDDHLLHNQYWHRGFVEKLYRFPRTYKWVMDNALFFEALPMDHAAFVRAMLAIPNEGMNARVRFELVRHCGLLRFLPEEERWAVLADGLRRFGDRMTGYWAHVAADRFGSNEVRTFLLQQLQEPCVAAGFLTAPDRHAAWAVFDTVPRLMEALRIAIEHAPAEFLAHAREATTRFGEMVSGVATDSAWHMYWCNSSTGAEHHAKYGPAGMPFAKELIKLADLRLLIRGMQNGDTVGLSAHSVQVIEQLRKERPDRMEIGELVKTIAPFPESVTVATVLHMLECIMTPRNAHLVYRWALSGKYYHWETGREYELEHVIRDSWFHPILRKMVEAHGWGFAHVEKRESHRARMGFDLQVTINDHNPRVVWSHDFTYYNGHDLGTVTEGTEVLVPPKEMRTCVHRTDRIIIYRDRMHPAKRVSYDMEYPKWGSGSVYPDNT